MSETEAVAAPGSVSDKIATFYVVPVIPFGGSTENVLYYEPSSTTPPKNWTKVSSKDLNARRQGRDAGQIKLLQPSIGMITTWTDLPADLLDQNVNLYAGVAKTLGESDELGSVYPLGSDGTLVIPVTKHTTRGLILIFTQAAGTGKRPHDITALIASPDPEIKNSTGG